MFLTVSARTAVETMAASQHPWKPLPLEILVTEIFIAGSKSGNINYVAFLGFTFISDFKSEFFESFIKCAFHCSGAAFRDSFFFLRAETDLH